MFCIRKRN